MDGAGAEIKINSRTPARQRQKKLLSRAVYRSAGQIRDYRVGAALIFLLARPFTITGFLFLRLLRDFFGHFLSLWAFRVLFVDVGHY